jgi:tripartite-type tricarboxylate transporter receptor subunit TctC
MIAPHREDISMKTIIAAMTCAIGLMIAPTADAQTYPDRPIKVVVPFAPGGAVDSLARIVSAKMQESMKQPVIVENRPGAGGNIAADAVAKSPPDGTTILLTTVGHAISPSLYKKLAYDPVNDLAPVTQVINASLLLVTNPKFPAKTLDELVQLARAKPGALNYGSTGIGNPLHLTMEMLKVAAKIDIQMVPFRGDAPLNQALVQGDVEMAVSPLGTAAPQVEAGTLRAIAVTGAKRSPLMPNVPTIAEQGYPNVLTDSWQGMFVAAKTPQPIIERIHQEVLKAIQDPDVIKRIAGFGSEPVGSTPAQFGAFVKAEMEKYARLVADTKVPPQD